MNKETIRVLGRELHKRLSIHETAVPDALRRLVDKLEHSGPKEEPMKVKQAMHRGVEWVDPDTSIEQLAALMRENDIGAIPIGENDRLVGMVTDRDIVCRCIAEGLDPATATAGDVMTKRIIFCRDQEDLDDAARIMELKQIRRLPVINDDKRMVGMLTVGDVSHAGSRQLTGEVMQAVSAHHS